ncbi:MAG: hypothetical protein M0P66_10030 [Salinivirgaceae bacterium]|nr:hypothetical protein [Salinivirgaceae bacterium]
MILLSPILVIGHLIFYLSGFEINTGKVLDQNQTLIEIANNTSHNVIQDIAIEKDQSIILQYKDGLKGMGGALRLNDNESNSTNLTKINQFKPFSFNNSEYDLFFSKTIVRFHQNRLKKNIINRDLFILNRNFLI